jgi:hypothetical protein
VPMVGLETGLDAGLGLDSRWLGLELVCVAATARGCCSVGWDGAGW